MSSMVSPNQISVDENAETLAKKLADAVMEIPGRSEITQNVGVDVGRAQEYRDSLHTRLRGLARQVGIVSSAVTEFSEAAAAAVAAIRAADAQAEEETQAVLRAMDGGRSDSTGSTP